MRNILLAFAIVLVGATNVANAACSQGPQRPCVTDDGRRGIQSCIEADDPRFSGYGPCEIEEFKLSIQIVGVPGHVISNPPGIDCTSDATQSCQATFQRSTVVQLTPQPLGKGISFIGWQGDRGCANQVVMNRDLNCVARFETDLPMLLHIVGDGVGAVFSDPSG